MKRSRILMPRARKLLAANRKQKGLVSGEQPVVGRKDSATPPIGNG